MKRFALFSLDLALFSLAACSDAPFVLADPPSVDAGSAEIATFASPPDALAEAQAPVAADAQEAAIDAGLSMDAPIGEADVAQDVATQDAAQEKAPNTCTPFPSPLLQFGSCTGPIDQPTYFVTVGPSGCENRVTPIMCTCQETYGCNCILNNVTDACGGARFVQSCGYATGPGGPTSGILIRCTK